jgi:hypothetical protein
MKLVLQEQERQQRESERQKPQRESESHIRFEGQMLV